MVKDGWVYCPICSNKTRTKIRPDTQAEKLPVFCPVCKNESIMNIDKGKAELAKQSQTPDAEPVNSNPQVYWLFLYIDLPPIPYMALMEG